MKPVLIDACCGCGGCTRGYQRAGFHVVGVDLVRQHDYCGDDFVLSDVITFLKQYRERRTLGFGWDLDTEHIGAQLLAHVGQAAA